MKFSTVYSSDPQLMWGYVNFPPFTSKNQEGQVEGFLADATRKVFKEAGVKFEAEEYPNRRIYSLLNNGDIQFGLFTRSFINDPANFVVSSFPIARAELRAYWVDDKSPITKIEELKRQRIILLAAYIPVLLEVTCFRAIAALSIQGVLTKECCLPLLRASMPFAIRAILRMFKISPGDFVKSV